jgi:uncharacterized membrane protein
MKRPDAPVTARESMVGGAPTARDGRALKRLFDLGALFKGAEGLLELVAGVWLAFDPAIVHTLLFRLASRELLHDPADRIAHALRHLADSITPGAERFAVMYLVAHGIVKVVLAVGLLRERRWAFPFGIVLLLLFAAYQVYRFSHTHAPLLPVLAALDAAIAWLVWREGRVRFGRTA